MFAAKRREELLDYITIHKNVSTKELSENFGISTVTVRSDLQKLEDDGHIKKVHGGAVFIEDKISKEIPSSKKEKINLEEKRIISELAQQYIEDGDVIILDAGTTTLEIAKRLKNNNLTIITNDVKIACTLASNTAVSLIVTGGQIRHDVFTLGGADTINFFDDLRVDKLFLGCDALDWSFGISNRILEEVAVKRAMIKASDKIFAVADHNKNNQRVFAKVCDFDEIDLLITDRLTEEEQKICKDLDLSFHIPGTVHTINLDDHNNQMHRKK